MTQREHAEVLEAPDFLFPKHTGLPFVVWISVRGGARHDVRVKISANSKANPDEMISVGIRPEVHVIGTTSMAAHDLELLTKWIELNRAVILAYWNEEIDTLDAMQRLRPLV
jgi:hypothetical protein